MNIANDITGIVLAAGFGTRLKPSTDLCPKPLIPVGGVEPLFFALHNVYRIGVRRVIVNAHHLAEKVVASLKQFEQLLPGIQIRVSYEEGEILGTGGALLKIISEHQDWLSRGGLLIQNGDTLARLRLDALLSDHSETGGGAFAISFQPEHLKRYKPLWVNESDLWAGIGAQSPGSSCLAAHFLGVHFLGRAALDSLAREPLPVRSVDLFNGIYRPLIDRGFSFQGIRSFSEPSQHDFWYDMNTPEYLLEAQKYVLDSMMTGNRWTQVLEARYPGIAELRPGIWVRTTGPRGALNPKMIAPSVFIGAVPDGIQVGPHACLLAEEGTLESPSIGTTLKIQNSVVVMRQGNGCLTPDTSGEIRVF